MIMNKSDIKVLNRKNLNKICTKNTKYKFAYTEIVCSNLVYLQAKVKIKNEIWLEREDDYYFAAHRLECAKMKMKSQLMNLRWQKKVVARQADMQGCDNNICVFVQSPR